MEQNNITAIHASNIMDIMKVLFPNGFEKLIDARRKSLLEEKTVIVKENPQLKILGGKVTVIVEFAPTHQAVDV